MKATNLFLLIATFCLLVVNAQCSKDDSIKKTDDNGGDTPSTGTIQMKYNSSYQALHDENKVKSQNFYWSTLIEQDQQAKTIFKENNKLNEILVKKKNDIQTLVNNTEISAVQIAEKLKFTPEEITDISKNINKAILDNGNKLNSLNKNHIEPSGIFNRFSEIKSSSRIHQLIVEEMLYGINGIIDTYGIGKNPKYPKIDKVSYDVNSDEYKKLMTEKLNNINSKIDSYTLFYQPVMDFALGLLEINNRDEAGRYRPLNYGENELAINTISSINWEKYPYSIILVLGDSPNSENDLPNISQGGMQRCDHAVSLYKKNIAPFIVVSGGHVFPFQTSYSEAIEMKKYLIEKHKIPENKIIVEPHARHTTTNMRNTSRLLFQYKIPTNKKGIVSTSSNHSKYLSSDKFMTRCMEEMKHVPIKLFKRLSEYDIEFTPSVKALHRDSSDPLDP